MDDAPRGWITPGFWRRLAIVVAALVGLWLWTVQGCARCYKWQEDRNFAKNRARSKLDCVRMPLHCAVRDQDGEAIDRYIASGKDLELRDNWGNTALFWALRNQREAWVQRLLDAGADPNTKGENGTSILLQAVILAKYTVADALLAAGANIDALNGNDSAPGTALHNCVDWSKVDCVRYLLDHGADPYVEYSGETVFEMAKRLEDLGPEHLDPAIPELLRSKKR